MKILLLVSSMHGGGAERVAANLLNAWCDRGYETTLVVTFSGRGNCVYPIKKCINLIYLTDEAKKSFFRPLQQLWRLVALRKIIRNKKPDIVLSFLTNVNVATLIATRFLKIPVIVAEHTYPPMLPVGWLLDWLRKCTYIYANQVVMLTSEGKTWLEDEIRGARGSVIPNPVIYPLPLSEPMLYPVQYISKTRKLLLAVGRLDEGKQFDILLDAFSTISLCHSDWDLVILGDGSDRAKLKQLTTSLRLEGRVFLLGQIGNISNWYARADLYVMSSRFEGFPNTLAEAMAHGCAAVSYDCDTGPRDIIRNEIDGLLVRPVSDVQALAQALDRLMGDENERKRMSVKAIEVRKRYSQESVLKAWDGLFELLRAKV
jgi:GalNAc-alpha-(1->4)-GalNAc-alpha-(1->3)-diNAcBac-PP-undecaprenol alpha-1,4-N-acetyl-D-galactosaminyltransferase